MAVRWQKLYKGTPAELALEDAVARLAIPYRTQLPGYLFGFRFFPDVFLPTLGLVLEVDDASHRRMKKMIEDEERTEQLESRGWRVLRTTNEEALADPDGAVRAMLTEAGMWPIPDDLRRRRIADFMPKPQKAPKRIKREAQSAARRARRVNLRRKRNGT